MIREVAARLVWPRFHESFLFCAAGLSELFFNCIVGSFDGKERVRLPNGWPERGAHMAISPALLCSTDDRWECGLEPTARVAEGVCYLLDNGDDKTKSYIDYGSGKTLKVRA